MNGPLVIAQIVVGAVQDMLFALVAGTLVCCPMHEPEDRSARASLARWRFSALVGLALACGLYLVLQAMAMSGLPLDEASPAIAAVLAQSHFGAAWTLGVAGVLLSIMGGMRASRAAQLLAVAGAGIYAAGKAGTGHAADAGNFSTTEIVQWVHLCASAVWVGSIVCAVPMLRTLAIAAPRHLRFFTRLSTTATIAYACAIATGVYKVTCASTPLSMFSLQHPAYSILLMGKIALIACATILAARNRFARLPKLRILIACCDADAPRSETDARYFTEAQRSNQTLAREAVLLVLIVLVAAALGHTSPPMP